MFRAAGFVDVGTERIPDPTPTPEVYNGRWFKDAAELEAFRKEGALLIRGLPIHFGAFHFSPPGGSRRISNSRLLTGATHIGPPARTAA